MGVMVSPLSLPAAGNSAGILGYALLWLLPVAALINFFTVNRYYVYVSSLSESRPRPTGSRLPTILPVLQILAFLPFCLAASTLILAAAGYVFNEVFVRWFPNLLFSVCFLVGILAVNLISGNVSRYIQNFSILLFSGSMLLLVVIGMFSIDRPFLENPDAPGLLSFEARSVFMLFWIFMAAELAVFHEKHEKNALQSPYFIIAAFAAALAVFWLWSLVSIAVAPPQALAESTGPQNIAAHFIAGNTGRTIMGAAMLAGGFCAVNTLLLGTGAALNAYITPVIRKGRLPEKTPGRKLLIVIISLLILAMLLGGMAGKEITFTIKRAAFYLWLLTYAGLNLHLLRHAQASGNAGTVAAGIAASAIYIIAFIVLIATDQQLKAVMFFMQ